MKPAASTLTIEASKEPSPIGYFDLYQMKNTLDQIKSALKIYLITVTGNKPTDLDRAARDYFGSRTGDLEAYKRDIELFFSSMKGRPPKTIQSRLSHVKMFLLRNHIDPGQLFWKDLKRKIRGTRAVTVDSVPTNEELRRILFHLPPHAKALFLVLSSSGMRIGEALKLLLDDVNLETDPIRLTVRAEAAKSGGQRVCFASREAKEAIEQWLLVRSQWLQAAVKKSTYEKKTANDPRLFPLTHETVNQTYTLALEKSGFLKRDPRTGYATFHVHTLRKFFRTRLGPILPLDIVEALLGHESYLASAYRRYTLDQLAEFYRKGEPSLWVLSDTGKLASEVQETRELLSIQIARLTKENEEMKTKLEKIDELLKLKDEVNLRLKRLEELGRK